MERTCDPQIWIEEQHPGYVRYRHADGHRWEVHGICDRRGDCLVGAVIEGEQIRDLRHLVEVQERLGRDRIDSKLDVPIGPGFTGCCPLKVVVL